MPTDRFVTRRNKLLRALRKTDAKALLVTNFTNVSYLTGFSGDDSWLLVSPNCTIRNYSNVATQSLLMMNSEFAIHQADHLAGQCIQYETELAAQLAFAWRRCFGVAMEDDLRAEMVQFVKHQTSIFQTRDTKLTAEAAHRLAVASACQAMFSSNAFLYVD